LYNIHEVWLIAIDLLQRERYKTNFFRFSNNFRRSKTLKYKNQWRILRTYSACATCDYINIIIIISKNTKIILSSAVPVSYRYYIYILKLNNHNVWVVWQTHFHLFLLYTYPCLSWSRHILTTERAIILCAQNCRTLVVAVNYRLFETCSTIETAKL